MHKKALLFLLSMTIIPTLSGCPTPVEQNVNTAVTVENPPATTIGGGNVGGNQTNIGGEGHNVSIGDNACKEGQTEPCQK